MLPSRFVAGAGLVLALLACGAGAAGATASSQAAGTIAYEGTDEGLKVDEVYVVGADGKSKPVRVQQGAMDPSWSPSGKLLAVASYLLDEDTCHEPIAVVYSVPPRRDASPGFPIDPPDAYYCGGYFEPTWSPSGRLLAVRFVLDLTKATPVAHVAILRLDGLLFAITKSVGEGASWSPGSDRVAFASPAGVSVLDLKTRRERLLVAGGTDPAWSPSGKKIAFASSRGLEVVQPNGVGRKVIGRLPSVRDIAWSPGGRTIAFTSGKARPKVYEANPDGSGFRAMTTAALAASTPSWSADGNRLAIVAHGGGKQGIWALRSSGGGLVRLTSNRFDDSPTWRP